MTQQERLYPLERLMLKYLVQRAYPRDFAVRYDLIDAIGYQGPFYFGSKKWFEAQMIMAFIQLEGLERAGYLQWQGNSRDLGRRGYHGGVWFLTEMGVDYADAQREEQDR